MLPRLNLTLVILTLLALWTASRASSLPPRRPSNSPFYDRSEEDYLRQILGTTTGLGGNYVHADDLVHLHNLRQQAVGSMAILFYRSDCLEHCVREVLDDFQIYSHTYDQITFLALGVDYDEDEDPVGSNGDAITKFKLSSLPTFIFYRKNQEFARYDGSDGNIICSLLDRMSEIMD